MRPPFISFSSPDETYNRMHNYPKKINLKKGFLLSIGVCLLASCSVEIENHGKKLATNRLDKIEGGSSCGTLCNDGKSGVANASISRPLLFELVRFEYPVVRKFMKIMGRQKGISKIEMGSSSGTKRSYLMETTLDTGVLEEKIYDALQAASINYENIKVKITPDSVRVQNLNR